MRIVVSGGAGFLGRALVAALRERGHQVVVLTRRPAGDGDVLWSPDVPSGSWIAAVHAADAVINLAGEGIADKRWSDSRKKAILNSRVAATRALAQALQEAVKPATVFLSGSAVGYYGNRWDEVVTEDGMPGSDFLARVCVAWEREAHAAATVTRVVFLRTGIVLGRDGGALPKMAQPFRFFVGGRLGTGLQFLSWIHRDDWVALVIWALERTTLQGPLNVTAPEPVTNRDFAEALGRVLHRPALVPTPAFALRLAVGRELADTALLGGQRVIPAIAMSAGFDFRYRDLERTLQSIYA